MHPDAPTPELVYAGLGIDGRSDRRTEGTASCTLAIFLRGKTHIYEF